MTRPPRYYAIRQARTKVIGSRTMWEHEAAYEVRVWGKEIGPAAVVLASTPGLAEAVRSYDQAVLVPLLATAAPKGSADYARA